MGGAAIAIAIVTLGMTPDLTDGLTQLPSQGQVVTALMLATTIFALTAQAGLKKHLQLQPT